MRPARAKLAVLVLALAAAAGCRSPRPPAEWDPGVRDRFPAGVVAIDISGFPRDQQASGVIVHSSKDMGTFVLTASTTAELVREHGARVHVFDRESGTTRSFEAHWPPLPPSADGEGSIYTSPGIELLSVETSDVLPAARLEPRSLGVVREAFFVPTLYPARSPRLVTLAKPPTGGFVGADGTLAPESAGSGVFAGDGALVGIVAHVEPEEHRTVNVVSEHALVAWLRQRGLTWVSTATAIGLDVVTRAEGTSDAWTLHCLVLDTDGALFDVRESAVRALGRLHALDSDEAERLAKKDPEPTVRSAAIEVELALRPEHGDALAASLVTSAERAHIQAAITAIGSTRAPLPKTTAALEGLTRSRIDLAARTWAGVALVKRGAALESLPADLRAAVLAALEASGKDESP